MKQDWIEDKLSSCIKLKSGDGLTAKKMIAGNYPVFGGNGIAGYHNAFNLSGEHIIIGRVGALCGNARYIDEKIWLTDNAFKVSEFKYDFDLKFLNYLLNYIDLRSYARQAAQPVISNSSLKDVNLFFPKSLAHQKQIVATLDKAFAAIDIAKANSEQNLQNAKELFESYLQNVFENKGNDWENKTISSLVDEKVLDKPLDGNHGETHPVKSDFIDSGVPFIMSKDLVDGGVNQTTCHFISREQADSLRKGFSVDDDVLLTHKGTIGRVAILKTDLDYVMLTPQVTYYRVLNNKVLYNRYLFYYLKSPIFQIPLKEIAGVGATRAYIGITKQRELKIRYPNNLNLQMDIVERLDNLSVETKKLEAIYTQKIADLEEMKKSLLQKAFSGQLSSLN